MTSQTRCQVIIEINPAVFSGIVVLPKISGKMTCPWPSVATLRRAMDGRPFPLDFW